jgi:ribosomal protein S18 acetylase RimI-like enzyme
MSSLLTAGEEERQLGYTEARREPACSPHRRVGTRRSSDLSDHKFVSSLGVVKEPIFEVAVRRLDLAELDRIEPLWSALRLHHAAIAPGFGLPRERADSWLRRRGEYERWLEEPGAFALVAEGSREPLGYAMVHTRRGSPTWPLSEPAAELETLSVLPSERGRGIGSALLDAVQTELAASGITALSLLVVAGNDEALGFYERHGFGTAAIWMRRDEGPSQQ